MVVSSASSPRAGFRPADCFGDRLGASIHALQAGPAGDGSQKPDDGAANVPAVRAGRNTDSAGRAYWVVNPGESLPLDPVEAEEVVTGRKDGPIQRSGGVESRHSASGLRPVLDGDASRKMARRTTLRARADITEEAPHRSPDWPGIAGVAPGPLHPSSTQRTSGSVSLHGSAPALGAAPAFTPEPGPQQVLKAEAARPDATDRGAPDIASPGGGPTGVGQPAAAGPAGEGCRFALWSNGTLQIERSTVGGAADFILLSRDEVRQLVEYLSDPAMALREQGASPTVAQGGEG